MEELLTYFNHISPLSEETQKAVTQIFSPASLEIGEFFAPEGVYAREVGFLQSGILRAFFLNKEGKEYNKQFFVGPSIIGAYTSLLTHQKNKIAQQALSKCTIWKASYNEIEKLYTQYHDLERLGRRIAEYYFLEKEQKEIEMALLDADRRYEIFKQSFPGIDQLIPQYHIASYLGISATQLSRIRKKMANK